MTGESKNDRGHTGAGQQPGQPTLGVIAVPKNEQKRDQENDARDNFTEKMWDRRLPFFFEIEIPNVTIDQRDDEGSAQQRGGRAGMRAQLERHSVHPHRGVKRKREAEEPEKQTEPHAGAPL